MKRGFFYTITVFVFLIALFILFVIIGSRNALEEQQGTTSRVRTMNAFLEQLEEDSKRAAFISGVHTLIALEQQIVDTGNFLATPEDDFREIFLTGALDNRSFDIMENSTFTHYLDRVQLIADRTGILIDVNVTNVTIRQNDPWNVLIEYTLEENMTDTSGVASWVDDTRISVKIPITSVKDPLFSVFTLSRITHIIKQTNVSQFVDDTGDANDSTGLQQFFNESEYTANPNAPSFFMRLQGNLSASPHGIESFIDAVEFDNQGLTVTITRSHVDWLYFGSTISDDICNIQTMPGTFKLDTEHLDTYQINGTLNYTTCI
ncbi:MAG: hypothetical protein OXR66_00400 [Candidatus Woesearchaeota archaeon]|nr:hypothetical protein [Candidatus Woesearchaeota archaeon]